MMGCPCVVNSTTVCAKMLDWKMCLVVKFSCLKKFSILYPSYFFRSRWYKSWPACLWSYLSLFYMINGDSEHTLRVLVSYYRQKTVSLVYQINHSESIPVKKIDTCTVVVTKKSDQCISDKLCQTQYTAFVNIVDQVYHQSMITLDRGMIHLHRLFLIKL